MSSNSLGVASIDSTDCDLKASISRRSPETPLPRSPASWGAYKELATSRQQGIDTSMPRSFADAPRDGASCCVAAAGASRRWRQSPVHGASLERHMPPSLLALRSMAEPPVVWWIGPPPPLAVTRLTRVLQLGALCAMVTWVFGFLGGLRLSPQPTAPDGSANDTSQLFNWHPLLITVAFPVLMAEAILAYKAPLVSMQDRWAGGQRPRGRRLRPLLDAGVEMPAFSHTACLRAAASRAPHCA